MRCFGAGIDALHCGKVVWSPRRVLLHCWMLRSRRGSSRASIEHRVRAVCRDRSALAMEVLGFRAALVGWSCCRQSGIRFHHHHGGARNLAVPFEWLHTLCMSMHAPLAAVSSCKIRKDNLGLVIKSMAGYNDPLRAESALPIPKQAPWSFSQIYRSQRLTQRRNVRGMSSISIFNNCGYDKQTGYLMLHP